MQERNPIIRGIAKFELNYARRRRLHISSFEFFIDFLVTIAIIVAFFVFFKLSFLHIIWWSIITFIICFIIVLVSQTIIGTSRGILHLRAHQRHNASQRVKRAMSPSAYAQDYYSRRNYYNRNYYNQYRNRY